VRSYTVHNTVLANPVFGLRPLKICHSISAHCTHSRAGKQLDLSDTTVAGVSNFAAGACASLSTQLVTVPIDVVSQRQVTRRQGLRVTCVCM